MLTLLGQLHNIFRARKPTAFAIAASLVISNYQALAEVRITDSADLAGRLVFTKISPNGQKDLMVANLDTGETRELFASKSLEEYPSWSPDGKEVLFYSDICGDREIFSIRSDGKDLKRLTKSKGVDEDPDWSPDGEKIVFKSSRGSKESSNIFVMNADGSRVIQLTDLRKDNAVPKWSPNGDEIVFASNKDWPGWDLLIHHLPTKTNFQLTTGTKNYSRAAWHPSGNTIAFSFGESTDVGIYAIRKGKGKAEKMTENAGRHFDPVFSDNGKVILFTKEVNPGKKNYQVFTKGNDTGSPKQITDGSSSVRNVSWTSLPDYPFSEEPTQAEESSSEEASPTELHEISFDERADQACGRRLKKRPIKLQPAPENSAQPTEKPRNIIRNLEDLEKEQ